MRLEIELEVLPDVTLCRPVGEIDASTVPAFRDRLLDISQKGNVVIDLSAVPFMDSAGLGALIGGIRRTREAGGDVAVACDRATLVRLLKTTGFDQIVSVSADVASARSKLNEGSSGGNSSPDR